MFRKKKMQGDEEVGGPKTRFGRMLERIEHDWIEIAATALLALATIMSAFSAYQSANWHGKESLLYSLASSAAVRATDLDDQANREMSIEVNMITQVINAGFEGRQDIVTFYENQVFTPTLKVAFDAWVAAKTAGQPDVPDNPFEMPQYKNKYKEQAAALRKVSTRNTLRAHEAAKNSNNYILLTVLFASVLFFAGIATKFGLKGLKLFILGMGTVVFMVSVVILGFMA